MKVEVEISPENGRGDSCYTWLPFVPPKDSRLTVIQEDRRRDFHVTDVTITVNGEHVFLYVSAVEMTRE